MVPDSADSLEEGALPGLQLVQLVHELAMLCLREASLLSPVACFRRESGDGRGGGAYVRGARVREEGGWEGGGAWQGREGGYEASDAMQ